MVFFTCNACGNSVKKAQVEKHYMTQCRNCEVLSCMDCGKDFIGDAYKEHVKCVTEDEKYGGKNYKAPATKGNKGEAKQEQWLQRVREAKDSAKLSPAVTKLLDRIADYPNVPRKKAKFENFVYNSLCVTNKGLVEQVWNIFSEAGVTYYKDLKNEAAKPSNQVKPNGDKSASVSSSADNNNSQDTTSQTTDSLSEPSETSTVDQSNGSKKKKKKKKDKDASGGMATGVDDEGSQKSKKKKRQGDPEVTLEEDAMDERPDQEITVSKKHKKKSKDKRTNKNNHELEQTAEEQLEESAIQVNGKPKKKKNKKRQQEEAENAAASGKRKRHTDAEDVEEEECTTEKIQRLDDSVVAENGDVDTGKPKKFKWERIITSVLQNCPDHQLSLKKLRKKVLNEFHACGGDVRIKSIEDLRATFDKKVNKNPNFKVHKETVKLIS